MRSLPLIIVLVLVFGAAVAPMRADACSCIMPAPPLESLAATDAVFSGTVTEVRTPTIVRSSADDVVVMLAVDGVWKGDIATETTVRTALSSASCGFGFEKDGRYLVYASETDGDLRVSLCSRTARYDDAVEDIAELGEPDVPTAAPSTGGDTSDRGSAGKWVLALVGAAYAGLIWNVHRRSRSGGREE